MYVQDVLRFDKSGKEAELIVSDGACEVLCYSYPIDAVKTGMTVSGLSGFSCTNMGLYNKSRGVGKKDRQSKSDQVK